MYSTHEILEAAQKFKHDLPLPAIEKAGLLRKRDDYFLNISYPSLQAMAPLAPSEVEHKYRFSDRVHDIALYVHVPFCSGLCRYCHYYKVVGRGQQVDRLLNALSRELAMYDAMSPKLRAKSIYVGGGTPSLLSLSQIERLFSNICETVEIDVNAEVSFEVHPEHASPELFQRLKTVGVTRINIGVESFNDDILKHENRRHTSHQAVEAVTLARREGFSNINIDLIYGLPYQTPADWVETLQTAASLRPASICAYYLRIKETTPMFKTYLRDPEIFPTEDEVLLMHASTLELMRRAGYSQSIVDWFFADPNQSHRYQMHNWLMTDAVALMGLGPSAYSYIDGLQYYNVNDLDEYIARVENDASPIHRGENLTGLEERIRRSLMLGIKCGIDQSYCRDTFGIDVEQMFAAEFELLHELGLISISAGRIELTPAGSLFADEIGQMFYSANIRERMKTIKSTVISTTLPHKNPVHPLRAANAVE